MPSSSRRDFLVGLFLLVGLGAIAWLSIQVGGLSYDGRRGLILTASFDEVGGLAVRAPVVISGVKVGQVSKIDLGPDLRARVTMDVDDRLELPIDTAAAVRTAGLLGDQFIALEPGAEDKLLKSGDTVSFTVSAFNIDKLVGRLVHGDLGGGGDEK